MMKSQERLSLQYMKHPLWIQFQLANNLPGLTARANNNNFFFFIYFIIMHSGVLLIPYLMVAMEHHLTLRVKI